MVLLLVVAVVVAVRALVVVVVVGGVGVGVVTVAAAVVVAAAERSLQGCLQAQLDHKENGLGTRWSEVRGFHAEESSRTSQEGAAWQREGL